MSSMKVFMAHNAWLFRRWLVGSGKSMTRLATVWKLWAGAFYGFMLLSIDWQSVMSPNAGYWFQASVITFFILVVITVYMRYQSGKHIGWHRWQQNKSMEEKKLSQENSTEQSA